MLPLPLAVVLCCLVLLPLLPLSILHQPSAGAALLTCAHWQAPHRLQHLHGHGAGAPPRHHHRGLFQRYLARVADHHTAGCVDCDAFVLAYSSCSSLWGAGGQHAAWHSCVLPACSLHRTVRRLRACVRATPALEPHLSFLVWVCGQCQGCARERAWTGIVTAHVKGMRVALACLPGSGCRM